MTESQAVFKCRSDNPRVRPSEPALPGKTTTDSKESESFRHARHFSDPGVVESAGMAKESKKKRRVVNTRIARWRDYVGSMVKLPMARVTRRQQSYAVEVQPLSERISSVNAYRGPVAYICTKNNIASEVKSFTVNDKRTFWFMRLNLPFVEELFGEEVQQWSMSNDNAKALFNPKSTAGGPLTRWHDSLMTKGGCCSQRSGKLANGAELLTLLRREGSSFVYALTDTDLFVLDDCAALPAQLLSKHAIICGGVKEVRCAGEFIIEGGKQLVINNRSGTYAPGKEALQLFVQLMIAQFPGLNAKLVDVDADRDTVTADPPPPPDADGDSPEPPVVVHVGAMSRKSL